MKNNKTVDEVIESIGEILVVLRQDSTKEFSPHVLKHKLLEIKELAKLDGVEEEREKIKAYMEELDSHLGDPSNKFRKVYQFINHEPNNNRP